MSTLPTGTVTFLFADIEGSTPLLRQVGDRYVEVLTEYRRLLRRTVEESAGLEIGDHGDAWFAVFPRATNALAAAVTAQHVIAHWPWPGSIALRVRMGLHTGEAQTVGTEYVGVDVHIAARICDAGHGGQILLSDAVYALVKERLPEGTGLQNLGEHYLKGLATPVWIYQVAFKGLPAKFPPLRSLEVVRHNLPREVTSFIGREREIVTVKDLLSDASLVTLTGAGGVGKTRLALRVAGDLLHEYPDGVWLADLASLSDPGLIPQAVASCLRIPENPGRSLSETLVDAVRFRSLLLILDNCEHLLTGCERLSEVLLRACPSLRILATSREPLRVAGEVLFQVPSLSAPDSARPLSIEQLIEYESVRLFVDRAALGRVGFDITKRNAATVSQIVRRLDGIPLAIELAAARIASLPLSVIAERLDDRLRLLSGGRRTGLPRHQTLRAVLDWSHDLLTERERILFRRLSVFAGQFTLEAAETICQGEGLEENDILDLLTNLVNKSLVMFNECDGEEGRYRLLETIGQYGHEMLQESTEQVQVQKRHRDWYLVLAEKAASEFRGPAQAMWLDRLEWEHDNFRTALDWSLSSRDDEPALRLACALWWFWDVRGHHREGHKWLEITLRRTVSSSSFRAQGLHGIGFLAVRRKDVIVARAAFDEALALSSTLGDGADIARSLFGLGRTAMLEDDYERAVSSLNEARRLFESSGDKSRMSWVSNCLGLIAADQGKFAEAHTHYKEGLALGLEAGDKWIVGYLTGNLGVLALREGSYDVAKLHFRDALAIYVELRARLAMIANLEDLGLVSAASGHAERAARLLGAAEAQGELLGLRPPVDPFNRSLGDYLLRLRATLGEGVAAERLAEGRAMSLDQAVAYALSETGT